MRVYLPSSLPALAEVLKSGEVGPAPQPGFAVTPALREWYASGDLEELEYTALLEAARGSLRLLAAQPDAPPRRVVLAVDVSEDDLAKASGHPAAVQVLSAVPLSRVAAGHVDAIAAADDVRAAVAALAAADDGDDDARFTVDGAEGHELEWYATQELYFVD
jgi:Family of unknown function (DUF6912)